MKKIDLMSVMMMILVWSIMGFAYQHSTFVTKDMFKLITEQLDRIETAVDKLQTKE